MAEIVIQPTGDGNLWDANDILEVHTDLDRRWRYASVICKRYVPSLRSILAQYTEQDIGGKTRTILTHAALDSIWSVIEVQTAYREVDFPYFPGTNLRKYLVLPIVDVSQADAQDLLEQITSGETMTKQRRYKFDWQSLPGVNVAIINQVLDRQIVVDVRNWTPINHATYLVDKTA